MKTFPQALQLRQKRRELSSQNTKSYNFLPCDYLQTVHERRSSLSWTVHTLLSESRGHVYPFIQVGQGSLIS